MSRTTLWVRIPARKGVWNIQLPSTASSAGSLGLDERGTKIVFAVGPDMIHASSKPGRITVQHFNSRIPPGCMEVGTVVVKGQKLRVLIMFPGH